MTLRFTDSFFFGNDQKLPFGKVPSSIKSLNDSCRQITCPVYQNNTFSMLNDYPNDYFFFNLLYFFLFVFNCFFSLSSAATYSFILFVRNFTGTHVSRLFFFDFHAARLKLNCALTNFKAENKKNILLIKFFFPSTLSWFFSSHNFMKMLYRDHAGYYFKSLLCSDLTRKEREKNQRLFALRVCRICLSVFSREC